MAKLELHMTLDELKRRYTESAEKPETMIDILADLNDTESTFIAYLLYHTGCAIPRVKMPRSPRSLDAPSKESLYKSTDTWKELEKKRRCDRNSGRKHPERIPATRETNRRALAESRQHLDRIPA